MHANTFSLCFVFSPFCYALFSGLSSFATILVGKRERERELLFLLL